MNPIRRNPRVAPLAALAVAALLAPASALAVAPAKDPTTGAAGTPATPATSPKPVKPVKPKTDASRCTPTAATLQPFRRFNDRKYYLLAPGGSFELGLGDLTLTGGAAIVPGNATQQVGGAADASSLSLPPGSSVTTAPMCVRVGYPRWRFFLRNTGAADSRLLVQVIHLDAGGKASTKRLRAGADWKLSNRLPVNPNKGGAGRRKQGTRVAFRFSAPADAGSWQIDDVYVDPYMRR